MSHTQTQPATAKAMYPMEDILVVKREHIFSGIEAWHGLKTFDASVLKSILTHGEYLSRPEMEENPNYKQIIPYFVFRKNDCLFLMQRKSTSGEKRLSSKFTLGIGGHVRKEDVQGTDILAWGLREFEEEVSYNGQYTAQPLGMINDDSSEVGKVHIGLVYIIEGNSSEISVKEELQWGELLTIQECRNYYDRMEFWSQVVFDALTR